MCTKTKHFAKLIDKLIYR